MVWDRVFQQPKYTRVLADSDPPRAVVAIAPSKRDAGPTGIALHALDARSAEIVASGLPSGPFFFHATDASAADVLTRRSESIDARPAWLYFVTEDTFVDRQAHDVEAVTADHAAEIAKRWESEWPSDRYVRSRIENGPTAGVYVDGELVAWAMTHFETDRVVMLGFFHVLEPHRRKGYGLAASSALTKDVLRRDRIPALHVFVDNEPSIRLVERLGYRRVTRQVWGDGRLR